MQDRGRERKHNVLLLSTAHVLLWKGWGGGRGLSAPANHSHVSVEADSLSLNFFFCFVFLSFQHWKDFPNDT